MPDTLSQVLFGLYELASQKLYYLWPDFSLIVADPTGASTISAWIVLILLAFFFPTIVWIFYKSVFSIKDIKSIASQLEGLEPEQLIEKRRDLRNKLTSSKSVAVRHAWGEFDESLVASFDQTRLYNTLDAEHFFNTYTLAQGLTESRFLSAIPSFLTAIGVLGTFVGLTVGLGGLQLDGDAGVDALREGIHGIIAGAAVAFGTSVWGVLLSLVTNIFEKGAESGIKKRITQLQYRIDHLFPRLTAEHSLNQIAESGRQSQEALQILHEKIGEKLQEQLESAGSRFQEGIATSLRDILQPEIAKMTESASQHSTQALEGLVERFMNGMGETGRQQRDMLDAASGNVQQAVNQLGEQMTGFMMQLSEQQNETRRLSQEQVTNSEASLNHLKSTSQEQQLALEQRFTELMEKLGLQIDRQVSSASERDEHRHRALEGLLERLTTQQKSMVAGLQEAGSEQQVKLTQGVQELIERLEHQSSSHQQSAETRETQRQQRLDEHLNTVKAHQDEILASMGEAVVSQKAQTVEMANQHASLLRELGRVTQAVDSSSRHLDSSASELGRLGGQLGEATTLLGQHMMHVTQQIATVSSQNRQVQQLLEDQGAELKRLQDTMLEGTQGFSQAAEAANQGFQSLQSHQDEFLEQLGNKFTQLNDTLGSEVMRLNNTLKTSIQDIEKQAEEWLKQYSDNVSDQTRRRLQEWDEHSRRYADEMVRAVQSLSSAIDEIEFKVSRHEIT